MHQGDSPYLRTANRLADVIAAIQVMATHPHYKMTFEDWAVSLSADKHRGPHWRAVFEDHPEFFRVDSTRTRASLVWRQQYPQRYDLEQDRELSTREYRALAPEQKDVIERIRLRPEDIKTLVDAAIHLHSRAIAERTERRWWLPVLTSGLAALVGAVIGALLKR